MHEHRVRYENVVRVRQCFHDRASARRLQARSHVRLFQLYQLALAACLHLGLFAFARRFDEFVFCSFAQKITYAHRQRVRDQVRRAHQQHQPSVGACPRDRRHDRERSDDPIETPKHKRFDQRPALLHHRLDPTLLFELGRPPTALRRLAHRTAPP
mmetsp:Transcript_19190/g.60355  ORF Transcript_19190/g.60355 Transcript_19190/m.60355 type:complete len:156 (-) Transcript_19190:72-539(-)